MLSVMNIDRLLCGAAFDYELLVIVPVSLSKTNGTLLKFIQAIHNSKCLEAPGTTIGGLLRYGLEHAHGTLRTYSFKNNFRFLEKFDDLIPYFKEYDVVMGPEWNIRTSQAIRQALAALIYSPYQFHIIKEECLPVVSTLTQGGGWGFLTEANTRLRLAEKDIKVVKVGALGSLQNFLDLQLFREANTIRIHYLYLRTLRLFAYLSGKILSLFRN